MKLVYSRYVEWSLHNPKDGLYNWNGMGDIENFLSLATEEQLLVILRPGPYICAERDLGGLPYWLLRKYPNIIFRSIDKDFKAEVQKWWNVLMTKLQPYLYGNGGPIIMIQIENDYGSLGDCDRHYIEWLVNLTSGYIKDKALLFTSDGISLEKLQCGSNQKVLPAISINPADNATNFWNQLRIIRGSGPLVTSEFHIGSKTHWQNRKKKMDIDLIVSIFIDLMDDEANINFYMFYGGTNFGFTSGANENGPGRYTPHTTSYDFDAALDESGNPTQKYGILREIILKYLPFPNTLIPKLTPKEQYGIIKLKASGCILTARGRKYLSDGVVSAEKPMTFEALDQNQGLVLYETKLPFLKTDPSLLQIEKIRDRAQIFVDGEYIGLLSRQNNITSCPILAQCGNTLQILVENQGRINTNVRIEGKGILGDVQLQGRTLKPWEMTKYSFENYEKIENFIQSSDVDDCPNANQKFLHNGPKIYESSMWINGFITYDTYLDTTGWGKGVAFINGFNLGRYWPIVGPQVTLYVPKEILKPGSNRIVMIEYQRVPTSCEIKFVNTPNLDGTQRAEI